MKVVATMLNSLLVELEENVDASYRARVQNHFHMDVGGFLGVPTPIVRKISAKTFRAIKKAPFPDVLDRCEELLETGVYECKIIAFDWSFRRRAFLEEIHITVFDRWLRTYVMDWSVCDDLCTHSLGFLIAKCPVVFERVIGWSTLSSRWMRRASTVSLIYGLRRGLLLNESFYVAERLLTDPDHLVQKGYGWMLKETSKSYSDEVLEFVSCHQSEMSRTALRYAVEKLPER